MRGGGGREGQGEAMIRSDPNYVGEIEPHVGTGGGLLLQTPNQMLSDSWIRQLLIRIWASQELLKEIAEYFGKQFILLGRIRCED